MNRIEILSIRLIGDGRPLRAFVDVRVNGWAIRDFRIVQQDGQRAYVMPPQASWKDPDTGEVKYKGILTIPIEEKQEIDIAILSAFQRERRNHESSLD